ncbi:P2X purinoceptor 4 [Parasteatoda tepidariorum]|uniref:P2X purinoceptor 4 n=1 Tax=Parasteatoda tepidariorum TaxID=114398 RepID=UPI00077FD03C|nr:P2X purinoceptor 4 [Parasteatoda tepidariorum]
MSTCNKIADSLFSYETPKIVQIKNRFVGIVSRIIQLVIIGYIIGYVIVYKKGYQEFCDVEGSITTKVKGVTYTNFSKNAFKEEISHPEWYKRIWDVADFVVPPSENGATFIATNLIITQNQTQETCPEDPSITEALCYKDNNSCVAGNAVTAGNGVMTGNCVESRIKGTYTCEIQAWCPTEVDVKPLKNNTAVLEASEDFTVLIKNFVDFPKFENAKRRNIKDTSNSSYLKTCLYDPVEYPDCPIFRLGDIVKWSGQENYNDVAFKGGVIAVVIKWDCNLDFDKKYCFPKYEFNRLDDPEAKLAPGWNFRYANYFSDDRRTLYKLFGIRLAITVVGQAGQFRIIPLLQNVGAGLGLLALVVVICDVIVLYLVKKRTFFKSKKFEEVDPENDPANSPEISTIKIPGEIPVRRDIGDGYQRLED